MDYPVIKSFIDLETNKGYNAGSIFTSEDVERASFLIEKKYLKGIVATSNVDKDLLAKAKSLKIKGYTKMSDDELKEAIDKALKVGENDGKQ